MRRMLIAVTAAAAGIFPSFAFADSIQQSTQQDQAAVEVTVYNNNLGLVKDVRELKLPEGQGELRFMDVAAAIIPETVHVKSLNQADKLAVLEQNYEYDLMNRNKLLDKYVGKEITLIEVNEFQDRKETIKGTLLSNNDGQIYQIDGQIYLGYPGIPVLPNLPQDLIARPTLTWLYANESKQPHKVEVSYLTQNMNWKADYVLELNAEDTAADLAGWVTIDNKSGAAYPNAKLKLVAGEVNRVQERQYQILETDQADVRTKASAAPGFVEQGFFEYHIYDLQRPATIKDNQTKQISLLESSGIKVEKEYVVSAQPYYFLQPLRGDDSLKQPVEVTVKFKNAEANHLGMPLPAGIMRLYKKDSAGSLQFIGEDRIAHTPKDEEVRLKIGEAFDVAAERKQIDYQIIGSHTHESEWEITLRNHKKEDVVVKLIEPMSGDWKVLKSSYPHTKPEAFKLQFEVPVPKDKEVKLTYRVRVET